MRDHCFSRHNVLKKLCKSRLWHTVSIICKNNVYKLFKFFFIFYFASFSHCSHFMVVQSRYARYLSHCWIVLSLHLLYIMLKCQKRKDALKVIEILLPFRFKLFSTIGDISNRVSLFLEFFISKKQNSFFDFPNPENYRKTKSVRYKFFFLTTLTC